MTVGCNIFKDKTPMTSMNQRDSIDAPVRVHQHTDSPSGAQVMQRTGPQGMEVVHVTRPRRGHDY